MADGGEPNPTEIVCAPPPSDIWRERGFRSQRAAMAAQPALEKGDRVLHIWSGRRGSVTKVLPPEGWECYTFALVAWDGEKVPTWTPCWTGDLIKGAL